MHPLRKQRLIIVMIIVLGASLAAGLVFYALGENMNLFFSPTQIAEGKAPVDRKIRAGGMVKKGSVKRDPNSLRIEFVVTDFAAEVPVVYEGILPDMFSEGEGVVCHGTLNDEGVFVAIEVLAKHDENYMPPEVSEALDKSGYNDSQKQLPTSVLGD
ncbi:cytochrome c maturation protein CcmE [Sinobacterium caligoides]|nr:cytochrome c maturation protein CcmE [Sinobacterium caligoides]